MGKWLQHTHRFQHKSRNTCKTRRLLNDDRHQEYCLFDAPICYYKNACWFSTCTLLKLVFEAGKSTHIYSTVSYSHGVDVYVTLSWVNQSSNLRQDCPRKTAEKSQVTRSEKQTICTQTQSQKTQKTTHVPVCKWISIVQIMSSLNESNWTAERHLQDKQFHQGASAPC